MNIKEKVINNVIVRPVNIPNKDERPPKGEKLFKDNFANIYVNARKKSGKTTTLFTIVKECVTKDTTVLVFCSTFQKDPIWIQLQKWLDDHEIKNMFYHSILDGKRNILKEFIDEEKRVIESQRLKEENGEEENEDKVILVNEDDDKIEVKKKKQKHALLKFFIIFDDISSELKHKTIDQMVKDHRHILSKVVFSSQWFLDLRPEARQQMDYCLLWGGLGDDRLKEIYDTLALNIKYDVFQKLYEIATGTKVIEEDKSYSSDDDDSSDDNSEPKQKKISHDFLYVDKARCEFRKNFNKALILD